MWFRFNVVQMMDRTGHEEPTNYRECTLLYFLSVTKFTYGTPTRQRPRADTAARRGGRAARHGRHMSLVQVSSNFELDSESNQQYSYGYDL